MTTHELQRERFDVLPRRLETFKISIGNTNVAYVGQANVSYQAQAINVGVLQADWQLNGAWVNQSN